MPSSEDEKCSKYTIMNIENVDGMEVQLHY